MIDDGISLTNIPHPRPRSIWTRIYWWLRCLRGIRRSSLETVVIDIDTIP